MGAAKYEIKLTPTYIQHLKYWHASGQKGVLTRIEKILESIHEHPESGIGKPERLKHGLTGSFSRRTNQEHRIIYGIEE
ncbi:hypothetical protein GCM10027275_33280 [Rhabdobacter roseus]|uniref:Putative mRNA interferase YoeB n=1 Tax=Rhabdobacter roseus TaxID=1655419 RepID=A0A840U0P8_9BACT|nr:Txe/YoeB family addiction module toxin [Rhabdobacter roseus]MBB5285449.1 toxin YoeB [Rhabdobacter roseus]